MKKKGIMDYIYIYVCVCVCVCVIDLPVNCSTRDSDDSVTDINVRILEY